MIALVGYTGFVGSNIFEEGKSFIDKVYNSKNIEEAFNTNPDLLIYSGVRAEKFLANKNPEEDLKNILNAEENIRKIAPKKLVLISTVDVFKNPNLKDENSEIDTDGLHAYGLNRYHLENWVRINYPDALIIRLPALFGKNLKKNFIYDLINIIPSMIKEIKMNELIKVNPELADFYTLESNGFYKLNGISPDERKLLKEKFTEIGFTALTFTDYRSRFQFYNLNSLWKDINIALENNLLLWHPATEPVSASEIHNYVLGKDFTNKLDNFADYDYRTINDSLWNGHNGYIKSKEIVLKEIKEFCETSGI